MSILLHHPCLCDDDDFPILSYLDTPPEPLKFVCYRVWQTGADRARFMTPLQMRYVLDLFPDGPLPEMSLNRPDGYSWERIKGGATLDQMVEWNLRGERY